MGGTGTMSLLVSPKDVKQHAIKLYSNHRMEVKVHVKLAFNNSGHYMSDNPEYLTLVNSDLLSLIHFIPHLNIDDDV